MENKDIKRYNGKVYTIRSHQTESVYVGSTIEKLSQRMSKHRHKYKLWTIGESHFVTSYEIMKYDDAYIELVSEHLNITKDELHKIEGETIRKHNCVNKYIAGRTDAQYYIDNKQKSNIHMKQYYMKNKNELCKKQQQYRIENIEAIKNKQNEKIPCPNCGFMSSRSNLSAHKKSLSCKNAL